MLRKKNFLYKFRALDESFYNAYIESNVFDCETKNKVKAIINKLSRYKGGIPIQVVNNMTYTKEVGYTIKNVVGGQHSWIFRTSTASAALSLKAYFIGERAQLPFDKVELLEELKNYAIPVALVTPFLKFKPRYWLITSIQWRPDLNEIECDINMREYEQIEVKRTLVRIINYQQSPYANAVRTYLDTMEVV